MNIFPIVLMIAIIIAGIEGLVIKSKKVKKEREQKEMEEEIIKAQYEELKKKENPQRKK